MQLKTFVKRILRNHGYDIVEYPRLPLIVHHLRQFFAENNIDVVLDVGAYLGLYCQMLRTDVHYNGTIISFEPTSRSFEKLTARMAADPSWRGFNFGLSNKNGEATLHCHGHRGDFNSVLSLKRDGADAYGVEASPTSEQVEFKTLDSVWNQVFDGISNARIFMKMDTQGHDTEAFLGTVAHLNQIVGLQSELPAIELYDGMTSISDTLKLYKDYGFTPVGFYPVNVPTAYKGAVPEFDTIFIRV